MDEFIEVCGNVYRKNAVDSVFVQHVGDENFAVHVVCNGVDSVCMSYRYYEDAAMLRNSIAKQIINEDE